MIRTVLAAALLCVMSSAEARHRVIVADPGCNVIFPCIGVTASPRGERIARKAGFGSAQKVYRERSDLRGKLIDAHGRTIALTPDPRTQVDNRPRILVGITDGDSGAANRNGPIPPGPILSRAIIVGHPNGCPRRSFCACGAAVRVFGAPIRSLWLAATWFKFPRTAPAPGMVAVRSHHVFVLESEISHGVWQVYDANSGGHLTRIHARSIAGYTIVNPRA